MTKKIKVTIEITQDQADRLTRWIVPEDIAGPSIGDRIAFLVDDACIRMGTEPIRVEIPTIPEGMTEEEHRQLMQAQQDVVRERYARAKAENPDWDDDLPF